MDLSSLPSAAWVRVAQGLPAEALARLSLVCRAVRDRNKDMEALLWQPRLAQELRLPAGVNTPNAEDPKRLFADIRSAASLWWLRPKQQPGAGPSPKNGAGLARLGNSRDIVLFGGSNHRTSRASSRICNDLTVLSILRAESPAPDGPPHTCAAGMADNSMEASRYQQDGPGGTRGEYQNEDHSSSSSSSSPPLFSEEGESSTSSGGEEAVFASPAAAIAANIGIMAEWDMSPRVSGKPPSPRWGHSFTSVVDPLDGQDAVFLFGGFGGGAILRQPYLLKRSLANPPTLVWEELRLAGTPPGRCAFHSATEVAPGVLLLLGGLQDGGTSDSLVLLDLAERRWLPAGCGPVDPPRAGHAAIFMPAVEARNPGEEARAPGFLGRLWLLGGCERTAVDDTFHEDPAALDIRCNIDSSGSRPAPLRATDLRLSWLDRSALGQLSGTKYKARCPLHGRVGRHLLLWGGYNPESAAHFPGAWATADTVKKHMRLVAAQKASAGWRAPHAREGGSCVATLPEEGPPGLIIFGGATFDRFSNVEDVVLVAVSQ